MASVNKVILIGNVGQDPRIAYTSKSTDTSNNKVAELSLATSTRYKNRDGQMVENTEWHQVVAWSKLADVVENYIKKGTSVFVEGRLSSRTYTDQNGKQSKVTQIVAENIQILTPRQKEEAPISRGALDVAKAMSELNTTVNDDLPF